MQQLISIPAIDGTHVELTFESGGSTVIVGANGSGKTRLATYIERSIANTHRIPAQRSIQMNDEVTVAAYERALNELQFGHAGKGNRAGNRFGGNAAIVPLNDFDFLLRALFAEQNSLAVRYLRDRHAGATPDVPTTKLIQLSNIWERLLPHRRLEPRDTTILTTIPPIGSDIGPRSRPYSASHMSDGERGMFYLIGQCLLAPDDAIIIIDEPELHIHKAILGKLWDEIEASRPDCEFVYIAHDLDFAVERTLAKKYFVRAIKDETWALEALPMDTGLPEDVLIEIVGNRQPVLFVEGQQSSIDLPIYKAIYPNFKIHPIGQCDVVIHAVSTFKKNASLHKLGRVWGCIDADSRSAEEIGRLSNIGVFTLPVAEVENLFLMPTIFKLVAKHLKFGEAEIETILAKMTDDVIEQVAEGIDAAAARYTARRIDRQLKNVTLGQRDTDGLVRDYEAAIAEIDPSRLVDQYKAAVTAAIETRSLEKLLALYDSKGLIAVAAKKLGLAKSEELVKYVNRLLASDDGADVKAATAAILPNIG